MDWKSWKRGMLDSLDYLLSKAPRTGRPVIAAAFFTCSPRGRSQSAFHSHDSLSKHDSRTPTGTLSRQSGDGASHKELGPVERAGHVVRANKLQEALAAIFRPLRRSHLYEVAFNHFCMQRIQ